jgi:LacI family transcriptional regulator
MIRVTQNRIAQRIGVSQQAVAFALSGRPELQRKLSTETKRRVLECAKALNYRPNRLARNLRLRSTKMLGYVFPNVALAYYAVIVEHLYRAAFRRGYNLYFHLTEDDPQEEAEAINEFLAIQVDGLIVDSTLPNPNAAQPDHPIRDLIKTKFPCVLVSAMEACDLPVVACDSLAATYQVTKHLLEQGYAQTRLLVSTAGGRPPDARRSEGFRRALTEHGVTFQPEFIVARDVGWEDVESGCPAGVPRHRRYLNFSRLAELGGLLARQALESCAERPIGLVCANDEVAGGAWGYCIEKGISVPHEVGITGCDDTIVPRLPLTSVRWNYEDMAEKLVGSVLAQIQGERCPLRQDLVGELIARKSTGLRSEVPAS